MAEKQGRAGQRSARREPDLRPVRWPGLPRRGAMLRLVLVAALLALAAGVLYAGPAGGSCPADTASPAPGAVGDRESADGSAGGRTPPAGTVGVPIPVVEPATLAVVRPGVRVDLLAVPRAGAAGPGRATPLAAGALVLDVVHPGATDGSGALYLALLPEQAHRAVGQPADTRFAVIVRP